MKRIHILYGYNSDDTITSDMMIDKHDEENSRIERTSKIIDVILAIIFILGGISIGVLLVSGVKNMQNVKASEKITKTINIIPTDKLDAECFATSITTGDNDDSPASFRAVSINNIYCKPNTESLSIKNKRGIDTTIYEGDKSNQILYYKEFEEGNGIFYFNIRENN